MKSTEIEGVGVLHETTKEEADYLIDSFARSRRVNQDKHFYLTTVAICAVFIAMLIACILAPA